MTGNVIIYWRNGFGNCLFQYAFARLIADHYGLRLCYAHENGRMCYKNPVEYGFITNIDSVNLADMPHTDIFSISSAYGNYEPFFELDAEQMLATNFLVGYPSYIRGLIEDYRIYAPHHDVIRSWVPSTNEVNTKDLVFHIRLGDNWNNAQCTNGGVIPPEFYIHCAERTEYEKLYIVTDDAHDNYHKAFAHLNPIMMTPESSYEDDYTKQFRYLNKENVSSCIRDFTFLRSFDNIVVGNSTFSWWAAFLGQNKNVFTYRPWQRGHVNLGQADLSNWTIVEPQTPHEFLSA
jgi:hypothetical protein